jgi:hypothetical protein
MRFSARVVVFCLTTLSVILSTVPSVADDSTSPAPAASLAPAANPVPTATPVDQTAYYGVTPRSYEQIPYPDFNYFIGFGGARHISDFPPPPTFMPLCSVSGISSPDGLLKGVTDLKGTDLEITSDITVAYRDLDDLLFRLRACDYYMSIYAWNTRQSAHDEIFNFSWQIGCNSFENEHSATALSAAAYPLLSTTGTPEQRKQALAKFLLKYYDQYADLFERVQSCSEIVNNLTYGPNKRRFFCNYGGFMGAVLTASAIAFGKHWGGSTSSTQAQVQALGTVMLALPGLCQNAGASPAKGKG